MDNFSSHKSKATMSELQKLNMNIYILLSYSPCLSPIINLICLFVAWICKLMISLENWILFEKNHKIIFFTIMKLLIQIKVKKYFAMFYEEIKLWLNSYK